MIMIYGQGMETLAIAFKHLRLLIYIYIGGKTEINEPLLVNRDDLKEYNGEPCKLVMQSWFGDYAGVFPLPWSDKITPIFLGFHLNKINGTRERFLKEKIYEKMIPYQPIGCRDRSTAEFLKSCGLDAYFSGCMTLTFDKREVEPQNGKIFAVDLTRKAYKNLPDFIKNEADTSITHFYYWNEYPVSKKGAFEFEQAAQNILNRYKNEAKLVITSKIHVAMPCLAMGIPVIFINEDVKNERFDVLQGLIPMYTPDEIDEIDWNPKVPEHIETIKKAIKENAVATILNSSDKKEKLETLKKITENLTPIRVSKEEKFLDKIFSFKRKGKHKILCIFGIKLKLKNKKCCKK